MNKKKLIFLGLDVLVLVITIGVSLAVFNYVKKGENPNRVTAGAITMNFTEGVRNISLPVATPTSDEEGKSFGLDGSTCQNDSDNNIQCYTDFTIKTNMNIDYSISYEVTLEKDEETTLNNEDVRIYLEKLDDNDEYKEVFTPKVYKEIDSENESGTDELGASNSEMLLDNGTINSSTTYYYRLRIWLSSDYTFTNETKDFVGKINVYGSNVEVNSANGINLTDNGTDINGKTITMQKGNTKTISAEVLPDNTKNKNLIWESSDTNKVKVDSAGNITAIDIGTSVITISTSDRSKSATFSINVVNYDAKSVELNTKEVTLSKGNTYQLTSIVTPTDASDTSVTYKSSSEGIATISNNGLITAVGVGETTITVETINGYTDTCKVIVTEPNVSSIVINGNDIVDRGSTIQLSTTITSDSLESSNVVWTSSDESKAMVSSTGKVTGIEPGTITITAYIKEYPNMKTTKTIEVQYPEIKSITMSSDMTINYGNITAFSIWISPNQVRNQDKIRWTSSNTSVAAISSNCSGSLSCTIDGVSTGSATIKAVVVKIVDGEEVETSILDTATLIVKANTMKLSSYITELYYEEGSKTASIVTSSNTLFSDSTTDNNIRYTGTNPNNYVWFNCDSDGTNCERWRIIGVFNNIKSSANGSGETRVKIMRSESIGDFSWDSSALSVNDGLGINNWENSDIMKVLNPSDYWSDKNDIVIGNSLYWNNNDGQCYNDVNNTYDSCNFKTEKNGLKTNTTKLMIGDAYWNLGSSTSWTSTADVVYNQERGNNTNGSSGAAYWIGKIALYYPSDYGYSAYPCSEKLPLYSSDSSKHVGSCHGWMSDEDSSWEWALTSSYLGYAAWTRMSSWGYIASGSGHIVARPGRIRPALYLKSNVVIKQDGADGSYDKPYNIALDS